MKFGVREICNVVLKAKAAMKVGDKVFYKNEPVCYFDSLKTSTMEGASTTVYAQGGRGNARLVAWEGERTVTFTMEDALISPIGFSILTGAGLIAAENKHIIMHTTEKTDRVTVTVPSSGDDKDKVTEVKIQLSQKPYVGKNNSAVEASSGVYTYTLNDREDFMYVMLLDDHGEVISEPFIPIETKITEGTTINGTNPAETTSNGANLYEIIIKKAESSANGQSDSSTTRQNDLNAFYNGAIVLVDYYVEKASDAFQVDITPDRFGGNFYLEAETLFRDTNGVDMPAEFVIPNCKVQSNFTFTMASSGDPSTFTFTMDAFPDYTRWDKTKKVFAAIQVIESGTATEAFERLGTPHDGQIYNKTTNTWGSADNSAITTTYNSTHKPVIEELY